MNAKVKLEPFCAAIKSFEEVGRAIAYMHRHHAAACEDGKPLVVRIDQKQDDRSTAQNRLYWMWLGQIERKTGQNKDSLHHEFKKKFLVFIYKRDDQEFAEMCDSIAKIKSLDRDEYRKIGEYVVRLTSTTKATVKQMHEYLNYIHDYAVTKLDVYLTVPDDLKWAYQE